MLSRFSRVWLFVTLWTAAGQVPLSKGFSRKNSGVGFQALLQGIFPTQGSNLCLLRLTALGHIQPSLDIRESFIQKFLKHSIQFGLFFRSRERSVTRSNRNKPGFESWDWKSVCTLFTQPLFLFPCSTTSSSVLIFFICTVEIMDPNVILLSWWKVSHS